MDIALCLKLGQRDYYSSLHSRSFPSARVTGMSPNYGLQECLITEESNWA